MWYQYGQIVTVLAIGVFAVSGSSIDDVFVSNFLVSQNTFL